MTYDPTHDRTEWRARYNCELIEAARDSNHELCIALGERIADLASVTDMIADLIAERDELDKRCDALRAELDELHEALKGAVAE